MIYRRARSKKSRLNFDIILDDEYGLMFKNECECFTGVSEHEKTDESHKP